MNHLELIAELTAENLKLRRALKDQEPEQPELTMQSLVFPESMAAMEPVDLTTTPRPWSARLMNTDALQESFAAAVRKAWEAPVHREPAEASEQYGRRADPAYAQINANIPVDLRRRFRVALAERNHMMQDVLETLIRGYVEELDWLDDLSA